jgi:hypothetical protein
MGYRTVTLTTKEEGRAVMWMIGGDRGGVVDYRRPWLRDLGKWWWLVVDC